MLVKRTLLLTLVVLLATLFKGGEGQCPTPFPDATVPAGFCARQWLSGLNRPRDIFIVSNNDMLVLEAGLSQVSLIYDNGGTPTKVKLAGASGLNHGIEVDEKDGWLYSSSSTTVFGWRYRAGFRTDLGAGQVVVRNIPGGGHSTRGVRVGADGFLYVQVGSAGNVDSNSVRSRIRRFLLSSLPTGGFDFATGEIFADGLRNEAGIRFDHSNRLWGVENGCDNLNRGNIGGDVHNDNPSEELNLFLEPGKFYGYPYCFSEFILPQFGQGAGTQWAHPTFMNDGTHTDAWCRNPANVVVPAYDFPAHYAPLDIIFYNQGSFPNDYNGGAFVSMHGSWNRSPAAGYRVCFVKFSNGMPESHINFFYRAGSTQQFPSGFRPVGLALGACNTGDCLYVSSDATGQIVEVSYRG